MRCTRAFAMMLLWASPSLAYAQPGALTLEAYLAQADEVAAERISAELGVEVARSRVAVAGVRPTPRVEAGLAQVDVSGQGAPTASYLGFTVPIELGTRGRRLDYARANAEVTAADAEVLRLAHVRDAALAFIAALEAAAELEVEQRVLARHERVVEASARRLSRGDLTRAEMLDAELELSHARLRTALAAERLAQRAMELRAYLGDANAAITPIGTLDVTPRDFDESALVERALSLRPDLAAIDLAISRAEAEQRLARSMRAPTIDVTAAWTHYGRTSEPQFAQHRNDTLSVLVGLPLPSPARRTASLEVARADHARWTSALAQRRTVVVVEVRTALIAYRSARTALVAYTDALAPQMESRREVEARAFEAGESTLLSRLDVERRVHELELERVHAAAEHHRALVRVASATGGLGRAP